jgi:hypothetical protein
MKKISQKKPRRKGYIKVPQGLPISQGKNSKSEAAYDWLALKALNQLPSQRELSRKWGWTLYKTRQFIAFLEEFNQQSITFQSGATGNTGDVEDVSITNQSPFNQSSSTMPKGTKEEQPLNQYLLNIVGVGNYACEEVSEQLFRSISRTPDCKRLLGQWIEHYKGAGHTVDCILAKDLGVCSSIVRKGKYEAAALILDWLFNCDRARPKYLRENGMLFLYNVCNKKVFAENFSLAQAWKSDTLKPVEQSTNQQQQQQRREPRYDERGFLIPDNKE